MNELISIIVPVYNAEKYIIETIESVRSQSDADWELLLVEDGSTDNTMQVMQEAAEKWQDTRIHIIHNEGRGAASARNKGLELAHGRFITYLDADDIWKPEKLARERAFMQQKQAGFVFSGYEFADEKAVGTGKIVRVPQTITYRQALANTTIFTSTVMIDTNQIEKKLLYMPAIKSEDTATWWQILRTGVVAYGLDENLVLYRRSGRTLSSNKLEALRRIWNLYRKAEHLSVPASCYNFIVWAYRAVKRRV